MLTDARVSETRDLVYETDTRVSLTATGLNTMPTLVCATGVSFRAPSPLPRSTGDVDGIADRPKVVIKYPTSFFCFSETRNLRRAALHYRA
jgi:hypothetical protein